MLMHCPVKCSTTVRHRDPQSHPPSHWILNFLLLIFSSFLRAAPASQLRNSRKNGEVCGQVPGGVKFCMKKRKSCVNSVTCCCRVSVLVPDAEEQSPMRPPTSAPFLFATWTSEPADHQVASVSDQVDQRTFSSSMACTAESASMIHSQGEHFIQVCCCWRVGLGLSGLVSPVKRTSLVTVLLWDVLSVLFFEGRVLEDLR